MREKFGRFAYLLCLLFLAALAFSVMRWVDLRPHVGADFFFGSNDPAFQDTAKILDLFPSDEQLILSAAAPDITSPEYLEQIGALSDRLAQLEQVERVVSLSTGPGSVAAAEESPMWSRMLLAEERTSTLVIALVDASDGTALIEHTEALIEELDTESFALHISGMPYIVEMIRRNLVADLKTFTLAAVLIFGACIVAVFRSFRILVGTLTACLSAIMLTLLIQGRLGTAIGPLTANLATIVFVLTQSHIVFLSANWQRLQEDAGEDAGPDLVWKAVTRTFSASFYCMVTTVLGFVSLVFVDAKPLRELGMSGAIGTCMAIGCAYIVYPPFMRWAQGAASGSARAKGSDTAPTLSRLPFQKSIAAVAAVVLLLGIARIDTDPSLLAYFAKDSELRRGLEFIDRNGGSSPMQLVVALPDESRLDNDAGYERMWGLQYALSDHEEVGTVVSLPVLMAEGHRRPGAALLPWSQLLNIMSWSVFDNVATNFVTPDRTRAMFLVRMMETGREQPRQDILEEIRGMLAEQNLDLQLLGGIYVLQGHMARLVASSLVKGLAALVLLFGVVAYLVSRSPRMSLAMVAGVAVIPFVMFGCIGLFGVPIDIISAPAGNVCLGIGVDAMIHVALAVRLRSAGGEASAGDWAAALREQRRPALTATGIVAAGFAIFALSGFPPTQRFGLAVVLGAVVAAASTLRLFPMLGGALGATDD